MMKLEYDKEVDAAYIYLEYPLKQGMIKKTQNVDDNIMVDFDAAGKMLGVEILNARKVLSKKALIQAQIV